MPRVVDPADETCRATHRTGRQPNDGGACFIVEGDPSSGVVPGLSGRGRSLGRPSLDDGHLVARQRAGLVRADKRRRAQRFDSVEVADEHLSPGHLLGAPCQRQRDRRQQRLGHQGNGHTDGEDEPVGRGQADECGDGEEEQSDPDGDDGHDSDHVVQLASQRRGGWRSHRRHPADLGEAHGRSRRRHLGLGLALDSERSREQRAAFLHGCGLALAGQHRGVDEETAGRCRQRIRSDPIARREEEYIAHHDLTGVDLDALAVASNDDESR